MSQKITPTAGQAAGAKFADRTGSNKQELSTLNTAKSQSFCGTCSYFRAVPVRDTTRIFCIFTGERLSRDVASCTFFSEVNYA